MDLAGATLESGYCKLLPERNNGRWQPMGGSTCQHSRVIQELCIYWRDAQWTFDMGPRVKCSSLYLNSSLISFRSCLCVPVRLSGDDFEPPTVPCTMPHEQQGQQVSQLDFAQFRGPGGFFEGNLNGSSADKGAVVKGDGLPAKCRNGAHWRLPLRILLMMNSIYIYILYI
jgi:hypothetical protein